MVIIYDKNTKAIVRTEDYTMQLTFPVGTLEEQKAHFASLGQDFIIIPYELGGYVYNFNLSFDANGVFTGLQAK